jgi:hypothetical protein
MERYRIKLILAAVFCSLFFGGFTRQVLGEIFVSRESQWKYEASGANLGASWKESGYDDSSWNSGGAMLGFGENYIVTTLPSGFITYYFRTTFTLNDDPSTIQSLTLLANYDDGFVAYINGQEVTRRQLPPGTITYTSTASSHESGDFEEIDISSHTNALVMGTNLLAVEIHQRSAGSSDVAMDMELLSGPGGPAGTLDIVRGPYLQIGTPNSIVVRWRTDTSSDSRVRYGTDPNNLNQIKDDLSQTKEHEVTLTGLSPKTRYYYAVGTTNDDLSTGPDYYFLTAPPAGTKKKTRIWILGDSGTANNNARAVRDAYYAFTDTMHTNLWVMLGDNAYSDGTDQQYQAAVFEMYPTMLNKSVLWPAFGNHDGHSASSPNQSGVFYDIFTLPDNAQAGGVSSGTEAYYSFNYANIHFICLNSHDIPRDATGPMNTWLTQDLQNNNLDWSIAFWHHPPYTKGSHDSDSEGRLSDMRENSVPILENGGTDLVFGGHSHSYERSYLLDGHYGKSNTLTGSMILDNGDGREDGDGAYFKPTAGPSSHEGTVYVVAGSSGKTGGGSLNHPAMHVSLNTLGSVVLDVYRNRLDLTFLDDNGARQDYFTVFKGSMVVGIVTEVSTFSGLSIQGGVTLNWETHQEANHAGFEILRANQLQETYHLIDSYLSNAALGSAGNSSVPRGYRYTDSGLINGAVYWYKLVSVSNNGERMEYGPLRIAPISMNATPLNPGQIPEVLSLYPNYPNPFNPVTTIRFDLPGTPAGFYEVRVDVFDIRGSRVKTLLNGKFAPGSYALEWNGANDRGEEAPSGIYIYSLRANDLRFSRRMVLVR